MKNNKRSPIVNLITAFSLVISLCSGILIIDNAHASSNQSSSRGSDASGRAKASKMSSELHRRAKGANAGADTMRVIIQFNGKPSSEVNAILHRNGIKVRQVFRNFEARAIELPASVVEELAAFDEVSYISEDSEVKTLGHVSATTGADAVRQQTKTGLLGSTSYTLDGSG